MRALLVAAFLCGALPVGSAEAQSDTILLVPTAGPPWYTNWALQGCEEAAAEFEWSCIAPYSPGFVDPPRIVVAIEEAIAAGVSGIAVQSDTGVAHAIAPSLRQARDVGIPIVAWSGTTLEQGSALGDIATTTVGVPTADLVGGVVAAISGKRDANPSDTDAFCLASFSFPSDAAFGSMLGDALGKAGLHSAVPCPLAFGEENAFRDLLANTLSQNEIDFVIIPFFIDELDAFAEIAAPANRETQFVSAYPSPYDLGFAAASVMIKIVQGETVDAQTTISPLIQISSDDYCKSCNCDSDSRCKRDCPKCNKS